MTSRLGLPARRIGCCESLSTSFTPGYGPAPRCGGQRAAAVGRHQLPARNAKSPVRATVNSQGCKPLEHVPHHHGQAPQGATDGGDPERSGVRRSPITGAPYGAFGFVLGDVSRGFTPGYWRSPRCGWRYGRP